MNAKPRVSILFGSESDRATMEETSKLLDSFGVPHEMEQASAHRNLIGRAGPCAPRP
jgi:5-(carboxyamino)imidazole ribonucleotide mutase